MSKKSVVFVALGIVSFFMLWNFIAPLYNHEPASTEIATIIKPARPLQAKSLRGHWTLVFFGYMQCPRICPGILNSVREAWNTFPDNQQPVRFVFANLTAASEPELQEFVHNYHPNFRGLTNDNPDMQYLYKELAIFAKDVAGEIDHSTSLMLLNPQGHLTAIFTPPFTPQQLVSDLKSIVN